MPPRRKAPKAKPQTVKLAPSKSKRPDYRTLTRAWNETWERELAADYAPGSTIVRCDASDVQKHFLQLEDRQMSKKKHLLEYNFTLSGRVQTREFDQRWKGMSVPEREEVVLWALVKVTDAVRDESNVRAEVPEITLDAMCSGDGSGWWKLVEHFLTDLVDGPPTDFKRLEHAVWNKQMLLDRAGDSLPLHRAIRAYQEEMIYDRHIFILLFLIACTSKMEGLDFGHVRGRNPEGTDVSELARLSLRNDPQKIVDRAFVETDTEKVCNFCERPKEDIPEMVASGKSFSSCSACKPLGRNLLYCSRDCQKKDYASHKKVCGKKLADVVDVPTHASAKKESRPSITLDIQRHLSEMKLFDEGPPVSWHAFYGTTSAPQKRILCIVDPRSRAAFEVVRDKAINERDVESVAAILSTLYWIADGVQVTRERVEAQTVDDFKIPLAKLKEVGMTDAKLQQMGIARSRANPGSSR